MHYSERSGELLTAVCVISAMLVTFLPDSGMGQSASTYAQPAVSATVEDVVVTAPSTSEEQATAQQSTPATATIVTQQQIEADQIVSLEDVKKLEPSLQVRFGNPGVVNVNIRGFGQAFTSFADTIRSGAPIYIDGVYQPRAAVASFDIPGLADVEVLKGPQSTAGGAESTGGIVNMSTALPSFVAQETAETSYGSYNLRQFKGDATGPINGSDWAAFRIGITTSDRDGYIGSYDGRQEFNSWHSDGARGQVLLTPSQDLTARFILDFGHMDSSCCTSLFDGAVTKYANGAAVPNNYYARAALLGYTAPSANPLSTYMSDIEGIQRVAQETFGASSKIDYVFNGFTFSSLSAFRGWDFHPGYENNGVIAPNVVRNSYGYVRELSVEQEFKVSTPKGEPVEATAGLFYFWETYRKWSWTQYGNAGGAWFGNPSYPATVNNTALNWFGRAAYDNPLTNSIAPYVQDIWHAAPNFDIVTGLRYTYTAQTTDSRWYWAGGESLSSLTPSQQAEALALRTSNLGASSSSFTATTRQGLISALASGLYHFTPDATGYVTYSRGGHAGGVNFPPNLPPTAPKTVQAEELDNYEVGLKSTWFNQRLLANVAAFVMVDHNYITNVTNSSGPTIISYLANAKRAISRGVELDLRAQPIDGLNVYSSLTYDDAYYGSFANSPCPFELSYMSSCKFTGKPLAMTPRWALAAGGEYRQKLGPILSPAVNHEMIGYFGADFTWQSAYFSGSDDSIYSLIEPYGLLNLHVGITPDSGAWDLSVWVKNALDKRYWVTVSAGTSLAAGVVGGNPGDPLMAGVTLKAKF